jgi:DNA-directed RNA polymerase sigma subunit (sigma70/sigma32)
LSARRRPLLLSREEEQSLARQAQAGDRDAINRLIESHLPLAVRVAQAELRRRGRRPAPHAIDDAIQAASEGLIAAVRRFDPSRGARFSTCAKFSIREAIGRQAERRGRWAPVPARDAAAYLKAQRVLTLRLERDPLLDEIAREMGVSREHVDAIAQQIEHRDRWPGRVEDGAESIPLWIDMPFTSADDGTAGSSHRLSPDELIARDERALLAERLLAILDPDEREVLSLRFGFHDGKAYSLRDVGKKRGESHEQIRSIEARALRRLQMHLRAMGLNCLSDVL